MTSSVRYDTEPSGSRKAGRLVRIGLAVLIVCAFASLAAAPTLVRALTRTDPVPAEPVDAVVALSAGAVSDTLLDSWGLDRLLVAIELARIGKAQVLVTTRIADASGRTLAHADQHRLISMANLHHRWTVPQVRVGSTRDEAVAIRSALPRASRIIVVTSPSHTRRACAAFEKVGFRVACIAAPVRIRSRYRALHDVIYESLARVKYSAAGWI